MVRAALAGHPASVGSCGCARGAAATGARAPAPVEYAVGLPLALCGRRRTRASSRPMPAEAPVTRAVLRSPRSRSPMCRFLTGRDLDGAGNCIRALAKESARAHLPAKNAAKPTQLRCQDDSTICEAARSSASQLCEGRRTPAARVDEHGARSAVVAFLVCAAVDPFRRAGTSSRTCISAATNKS